MREENTDGSVVTEETHTEALQEEVNSALRQSPEAEESKEDPLGDEFFGGASNTDASEPHPFSSVPSEEQIGGMKVSRTAEEIRKDIERKRKKIQEDLERAREKDQLPPPTRGAEEDDQKPEIDNGGDDRSSRLSIFRNKKREETESRGVPGHLVATIGVLVLVALVAFAYYIMRGGKTTNDDIVDLEQMFKSSQEAQDGKIQKNTDDIGVLQGRVPSLSAQAAVLEDLQKGTEQLRSEIQATRQQNRSLSDRVGQLESRPVSTETNLQPLQDRLDSVEMEVRASRDTSDNALGRANTALAKSEQNEQKLSRHDSLLEEHGRRLGQAESEIKQNTAAVGALTTRVRLVEDRAQRVLFLQCIDRENKGADRVKRHEYPMAIAEIENVPTAEVCAQVLGHPLKK